MAILGASVSQQSRNHVTGEITGYSEIMRTSHAENLGFSQINRFTYPGNRASDGGMVAWWHGGMVAWWHGAGTGCSELSA